VNEWDTFNLVVPVAHIWYFRSLPNKIGYLLGLPTKKLDTIIYYERYVVIQPGVKLKMVKHEY
jgi:DNA-directed RNA polymerase subunit beta'